MRANASAKASGRRVPGPTPTPAAARAGAAEDGVLQAVDQALDAAVRTAREVSRDVAAVDRRIEPDLSNAAPFLAAGMATGGRVTVLDWPAHTEQPGDALRDLLVRMGAAVDLTGSGLVLTGADHIHGIEADLSDVGELAPTLAGLAALADSPSRFTGIAHLRGHETDRLAALATEINRLGGDVDETPDGLVIRPRPLHAGQFRTYGDHRMATTGAVIGLRVPGVEVEDIATTGKTLPDFTVRWDRMIVSDAGMPTA